MGAEAFAIGNHVAFAATPDLHTAAHEAAHVVQQRGGVQLKGGVGEAGDPHEQHANDVADRVVAGDSAEDLLDRYATGAGSATAAGSPPANAAATSRPTSVQRQSTPPPAPDSGTPAATTEEQGEAYHAPTSAQDPNAPASRNASWDQVHSAAGNTNAQQALDIAWVEDLPPHMKNTIDEAFADSVADATAARAAKSDGGLKQIDVEIDAQEKALRAETSARLAAADPSVKPKQGRQLEEALTKDQTYVTAKAQLETERALRKQQRKEELRTEADGPMAAGSRADSVTSPSTPKVTRLEGKALARTNFVSWAIDVLGSTEAAKRHFQSIRQVSRQPGMFLIETAKTRFEAARADFEARHPGYSFPSTDIAQSLRGFHQARQGIGMLGHALGIAFDFLAYDNPNQKLGETENYGYLLDRFGGDGDKRGRSNMTLGVGGEQTVAQLGRPSWA